MSITPQQHQILMAYLSGQSGYEIAKAMGLSANTVYYHLRNPIVKAMMVEKLRNLDVQLMEFKIKAIEASSMALDRIINLSQNAKEEKLQRDCSNDIIRIAGLEPSKRVIVQGNTLNGIDEQTLEYYDTVVAEIAEFSQE